MPQMSDPSPWPLKDYQRLVRSADDGCIWYLVETIPDGDLYICEVRTDHAMTLEEAGARDFNFVEIPAGSVEELLAAIVDLRKPASPAP